jgi:hypothetical protein
MTDNFGVTIDSDSASFSVGFAVVNTNFISAGANWKFLDNGSNPGASWVQPGYDDQAWASGPAQLGYGDNDEATVVGFGPSSSAKFVTTYFRRTFDKPVDWVITNLTFRLVRDDGAVVWLNGREAYRVNMPGGAIGFNTLASATVDNENEDAFFATTLAITNLNTGANTVAVEIHQRTVGSSDISFDLELSGAGYFTPVEAPEPRIVKMPNGQVGVSWRTTAGWALVTSPGLGAGATWLPVGIPPSESGGSSTVLINPGEENAFYRLVK